MKLLLIVALVAAAVSACALGRHDNWDTITDATRQTHERTP